jgi:cation:H+ antiporter
MTLFLMFAGGLIALVIGANLLVRGAAKLALSFGISALVVGLTVVAFGTSAPEVAVSVGAVLDGKVDIAIGNVVGSNIFNVLFILGVSALIAPLIVNIQLIKQEVPVMIAASVVLVLMVLDGNLAVWESGLLLAALVGYTAFLVIQSRKQTAEAGNGEFDDEVDMSSTWDRHWSVQVLLIIGGLVLLVIGSRFLVEAAVTTAKMLGVSDLVIGLTIVAAGTSLPEVAASVTAAIKGQRDIAVGNVVGSNLFNILACLGLSGVISPVGLAVAPSVISFDIWVMLAVAVACLPIFITGREIARWEGAVFVGYYVAYTAYLIMASQEHDALPMFSNAMLYFVVPITVITLLVSFFRQKNSPSTA